MISTFLLLYSSKIKFEILSSLFIHFNKMEKMKKIIKNKKVQKFAKSHFEYNT